MDSITTCFTISVVWHYHVNYQFKSVQYFLNSQNVTRYHEMVDIFFKPYPPYIAIRSINPMDILSCHMSRITAIFNNIIDIIHNNSLIAFTAKYHSEPTCTIALLRIRGVARWVDIEEVAGTVHGL